jgi:hypothetical protein
MYAKIENNVAVKWPYTKDDLRQDNPRTSFSSTIPDELLSDYGVVDVFIVNQPQIDYTKNITQKPPVFNAEENRWETSWEVTNASEEEIQRRSEQQSERVRAERNSLLSQCDWTQMDDSPLSNVQKAAWATYRQALRDVTTQSGFPWTITWPDAP